MQDGRSRYSVRISRDDLAFCSGHFITFDADHCERLHGHNYRAAIEFEGALGANHYVVDFLILRDLAREVVGELDHRMLLPGSSPYILLEPEGPNWRVRYKDRSWSFPKDECVVLPVANTTAERLADHLLGRLREGLKARGAPDPVALAVEVEESPGFFARVEWRPGDATS